ncbi:hypothetical protein, partial [Chlorobium limicola]|uniref:hypothetical protein n=1 Tax=Chlorobium limicola TaxID=1092 RepID=UPI001F227E49
MPKPYATRSETWQGKQPYAGGGEASMCRTFLSRILKNVLKSCSRHLRSNLVSNCGGMVLFS